LQQYLPAEILNYKTVHPYEHLLLDLCVDSSIMLKYFDFRQYLQFKGIFIETVNSEEMV